LQENCKLQIANCKFNNRLAECSKRENKEARKAGKTRIIRFLVS
jgi:hypothetical protein